MGINLGAFISPFVTGYLAQSESFKGVIVKLGLNPAHAWHWGFAAAGVGMTLGVIQYILGARHLKDAGRKPEKHVKATTERSSGFDLITIILSVVGAVIMLVVGASLARAFGIVGAANLIRYRSKIDDPKDAVVMLCTLAVGLASGVGLYALAVVSTAFIAGALWVIESFEAPLRHFELKIKAGDDTDSLRPKIEHILRRYQLKFELRTSSDEEVCYDVQVPFEVQTDRISNTILRLDREGHAAVDWSEKKNNKK